MHALCTSQFVYFTTNIRAACSKCKGSFIFYSYKCNKCFRKVCCKHPHACANCCQPSPLSKSKHIKNPVIYLKYSQTVCASHYINQTLIPYKERRISLFEQQATCIAKIDSNLYTIGTSSGTVSILTNGLKKDTEFKSTYANINCMIPHNNMIFACTDGFKLLIYDITTKNKYFCDACSGLNMDAINEQFLAICGITNYIYLYDIVNKEIKSINLNIKGVFDVITNGPNSIAYTGMDNTFNLLDLNKEATYMSKKIDVQHEYRSECLCHYRGLFTVPDSIFHLNLYDVNGNLAGVLNGHEETIRSVKLIGDSLVSCGDDNNIIFWKGTDAYYKYQEDNLILGFA